ncbi:MAG: hypothetical protein PHO15_05980 [Eubacteriales bacterium]|nr:hypothetical protein [Eubacteriales bacterium]
MPYIQVNVTKPLQPQQKEQIKNRMGELISLIPGKSEAVTMVDITGNRTLYLGGRPLQNGAFIDVRLFGTADKKSKETLTAAMFEAMHEMLGTAPGDIYLNIFEMPSWGANGRLM